MTRTDPDLDPQVIANGLTYMDRKHLRRAGRGQRVPYTGARSLSRMGLYDGCALTPLGRQVLEEIGDPRKP